VKVKFPISGTSQIIVKSVSTCSPFVRRPGRYRRTSVVDAVAVVAVVVVVAGDDVASFQSHEPRRDWVRRNRPRPRIRTRPVPRPLPPPLLLPDLQGTWKQ